MLTDFERHQLTNQTECYIHTHPRQALDQLSAYQLQQATPVITVASGDTLTAAQDVVSIDPAGAAVTLNLPQATGSKEYHITMVGSGTLTIYPDGTDTICGSTPAVVTTQWTSLHLKSDGVSNWITL